jgi:hypothetical protein
MALRANYDFLFVGKDDNSYLENFSYDLYDKHGDKSGEIFINLEIQNNPANSEEIGEAVFSTFQKVFFEDVEAESYVRFEAALKATNAVLAEFKKQKVSGYIGNLNIVIAAFIGGTLYLSQSGDAEAYLCRKKFVSVITEGLFEEESKDVFTNIANGSIEEGDTVLISSTRLLRYVTKNDLGRILSGVDPADVLGEVKDVISTEMLGKVGLTGVVFKQVADSVAAGGEVKGGMFEESVSKKEVVSTPSGVKSSSVFSKVLFGIGGAAKGAVGSLLKKSRERRALKRARTVDMRTSVSSLSYRISEFKRNLFRKGFGGGKVLVTLGVVLIVLIAGIWIIYDRRAAQAELDRLDTLLTDVQNKISEAETKGQYDKEAAGLILEQAGKDAMEVLNSGNFRDKASILLSQVSETKDSLDGVKRVKEPKLVADLTTKRSTVSALGFVTLNDRLFVFEYNALYELVLDQVQDPVTLDETETVIAGAGFDDRSSLVFLTKSGKLIEYKDGALSYMDCDDGAFHKGVALRTWTNRVYILDPESNQIWKYAYKGTQDGFGAAAGYTQEGDMTLGKDFAIDSNIWLLTSAGIEKYYGGAKQSFVISKAPFKAFKNPVKILTNDEMAQVFVLDSEESRILVFYKDENTGNLIYSNQYVVDGVGEIRDISVDLTANRMKVLTPTMVYEFDM